MKEINENNLKDRILGLEEEVKKLNQRNLKVEANKLWETSTERKLLVASITYSIVVVVMYFLKLENIFISALIPTCGFLLSTLSINKIKKYYLKRYIKKRSI